MNTSKEILEQREEIKSGQFNTLIEVADSSGLTFKQTMKILQVLFPDQISVKANKKVEVL